jgi:hypothetical protein
MIGQWDDRDWGGKVPELTYDLTNPLTGLTPGFIKRDRVGWYSDHCRAADGSNKAYEYCYLFRYALDIPSGTTAVTLPDNPHVKILAATLSSEANDAIVPAAPLYDTLIHQAPREDPVIFSEAPADGSRARVTINPPLYFSPGTSVHYTLDGTAATAASSVYAGPLDIWQSVNVSAVYVDAAGAVKGSAEASVRVTHPAPPHVVVQMDELHNLNGTGDGVVTPPVFALPASGNSKWTINFFAWFDAAPEPHTILGGFGDAAESTGSQRYLTNFPNGIHFWASHVDVDTGVPYDVGKWQMITATFDGNAVSLYKNALLLKNVEIKLHDAVPVANIAPLGPWPTARRMVGKIAGFRIWDTALPPDDVAKLLADRPK